MSNTIINKQRFLVHSKTYSSAEVKKYRLSIPANTPVTTDMFFGSQGYNSYVQNGHGMEDVEILDDVTPEEAKQIRKAASRGYASNGYVADEHGVASGLDIILSQIDSEEGNDVSEWQRSPFTISSMGRLNTPELRDQMADLMRKSFSEKGNIVWYPIVSIESYKVAESMKLFRDEDYEAVILESLPRWFKSVNLNPDNMLWSVDYHNNTDNPHLHYIFLEKVQTRTRGNFSVSDLNNLKEQFYASAMRRARTLEGIDKNIDMSFDSHPELKAMHKQMDEANRRLKLQTDGFISKKMDQKIDQDILKLFAKIDEVTLGRGKMTMNSKNMAPFRKDVLKIVDEVLEHPANRELYEEVKQNWKNLDQASKGEVSEHADRYQVNEDRRLRTSIGNAILKLKKDYDSAYGKSVLPGTMYDQLSRSRLKKIRQSYLESRDYEIIDHTEDNSRGFSIVFENEKLKDSFIRLIDEARIDDLIGIRSGENSEINFVYDSNDEEKREYNSNLFRQYFRSIINNLQDHPDHIDKEEDSMHMVGGFEDFSNAQKAMLDYILENRNQPDSDFFMERKPKKLFNAYMNNMTRQMQFLNQTDGYSGNQSNSYLVLNGLNRLLGQRVHNTIAAQRVEQEAERYWERQQELDKQKQQEEYDYEITY